MEDTYKFGRLDKSSKADRFECETKHGNDVKLHSSALDMSEVGNHWSLTIKNYTAGDILLVGSLRCDPQRIPSIYRRDNSTFENTTNYVIIELRHKEVSRNKENKTITTAIRTIKIKCPGYHLENNSIFIDEIGCYVTVDSRLDATRELMAKELRSPSAEEVSIPPALMAPNPTKLFGDFRQLVQDCIERSDRIMVNVGTPVRGDPAKIPDYVKNLRIAVLDQSIVPYRTGQIQYDPSLEPDEFVIKNLLFATDKPLRSTFSKLRSSHGRAIILDSEEHKTTHGYLCGLGIFADDTAYVDYVHAHRSEELFDELSARLADRNGDVLLKKQLEGTHRDLNSLQQAHQELEDRLKLERDRTKEQTRQIKMMQETIEELKTNGSSEYSRDAVLQGMENERIKLQLEVDKLSQERDELKLRQSQVAATNRVTVVKHIADVVKSSWGIVVVIGAIFAAYVKMKNKVISSST